MGWGSYEDPDWVVVVQWRFVGMGRETAILDSKEQGGPRFAISAVGLLASLSLLVGTACVQSRIYNPPASATPPHLSRMAAQPADMAQRLKAAFPREVIGRPGQVTGSHFALVKIQIAADGHVAVRQLLQSSHPAAAQACNQVLTASVWQPALDKEGNSTATRVQYTCIFRTCENWDCDLQLP